MTAASFFHAHLVHCHDTMPAIPQGIEWIRPLATSPETDLVFSQFLQQYYNDSQARTLVLGINPGRHGAGVTNVAFTDPWHLKEVCGIDSSFDKKAELSAIFINDVVRSMGGPAVFYQQFFINSVCPYGFTKDGKNYNYYDSKDLQQAVKPYIVHHLQTLSESPWVNREAVFILGEGKNAAFIQQLNATYRFFDTVHPLPHPRFILQYKRKLVADYKQQYIDALSNKLV